MTWEIALGVIALFGFVITCVTVSSKVASAMGEFKSAVADLKETLNEFRCNAHDTHDKLFGKLDDHTKKINDHETRIKILEKGDKK